MSAEVLRTLRKLVKESERSMADIARAIPSSYSESGHYTGQWLGQVLDGTINPTLRDLDALARELGARVKVERK